MERFKKIVLEKAETNDSVTLQAEKGNVFATTRDKNETLRIKSVPGEIKKNTGDYMSPPVPEMWKHVRGEWNTGFIIQDNAGNEFVWIPVGALNPNGTLDGKTFNERFGRRNYQNDEFSDTEFNEKMDNELLEQINSVKKYGGFYISCFTISRNEKTGEPQSVKGQLPWTGIDWIWAKKVGSKFGDGRFVKSHLTFGAEYDSTLEWIIVSKAKSYDEVANDSTKWGNFWNNPDSSKAMSQTGCNKEWTANGICDLAGNVEEWTQEKNGGLLRVTRGGNYLYNGDHFPVSYRNYYYPYEDFAKVGFRVALYIA